MKKKKTLQSLLFEQQVLAILVFTIMVLFIWIGASIYFAYTKSSLEVDETYPTQPLNPRIDVSALEQIQQRKWWKPEELTNFSPSVKIDEKAAPLPTAAPRIVATPISTSSATVSPTPTATSSGQL